MWWWWFNAINLFITVHEVPQRAHRWTGEENWYGYQVHECEYCLFFSSSYFPYGIYLCKDISSMLWYYIPSRPHSKDTSQNTNWSKTSWTNHRLTWRNCAEKVKGNIRPNMRSKKMRWEFIVFLKWNLSIWQSFLSDHTKSCLVCSPNLCTRISIFEPWFFSRFLG